MNFKRVTAEVTALPCSAFGSNEPFTSDRELERPGPRSEYLGVDLSNLSMTDEDLDILAPYLQNVVLLNLSGNQIGDHGARIIAFHMPKLKYLDLSKNKITARGSNFLIKHLKHLEIFDLPFNISLQ